MISENLQAECKEGTLMASLRIAADNRELPDTSSYNLLFSYRNPDPSSSHACKTIPRYTTRHATV
jgi:hypothetical protein